MVGWHHQLNGQESEQTLGDSEGQGSLECCSPWGGRELDTTVTEQQHTPISLMNNQGQLMTIQAHWE